jgi:hypothetical protein
METQMATFLWLSSTRNAILTAAAALALASLVTVDDAYAISRGFQIHSAPGSQFQALRPRGTVPGNVRLGPWQTLNSTNSVNSRNSINSINVQQAGQAWQPRIGPGSSIRMKTMANCIGAMGRLCASDIRLKRDIVLLAHLNNGLGLYRYRYSWSDQLYVGVMAKEVAALAPEAVVMGRDGYLRVNYALLGLRMQTWDEWRARHPL